jgi:hypothetical protein
MWAKRLIDFNELSHLQKEEPRKLLSICRNIYKQKGIMPLKARDILEADENKLKKYQIYDNLYAFNAIYVTTNYDKYLDEAAKNSNRKLIAERDNSSDAIFGESLIPKYCIVSARDDLLISKLDNGTIIHLHGSCENETDLIITLTDYMKHYAYGSKPAVLLDEIFNSYTVLFVGYGLEEYEILEFMIQKRSVVPEVIQHYMLYPVFRTESHILKFQESYYSDLGIALLPYPKDNNGYAQLAHVIREWARQIGPIARPQQYYEKIKLIDEVI